MAESSKASVNGKPETENNYVKGSSKRSASKACKGKAPANEHQSMDTSILQYLQQIQNNQNLYGNKVDGLMDRLRNIEQSDEKPEYYNYQEYSNFVGYEAGELCAETHGVVASDKSVPSTSKINDNSRFAIMARRSKGIEIQDEPLDSSLADTINDLFRKGMDEENL